MDITYLPFNRLIGITEAHRSPYMLMLPDRCEYTNHIGTVHASAMYSLAEATSGYFLLQSFPNGARNLVPVVRSSVVKYKSPCKGVVYSLAHMGDAEIHAVKIQLAQRERAIVKIYVDCFNENDTIAFTGEFDWFISIAGNPS